MRDDSANVALFVSMNADQPATRCFGPVIERWKKLGEQVSRLPSSRDFQPDHLTDFPSRVSVIEPVDAGCDFRYVIYAAAIVEAGGVDMTGYCLSDFHDEALRIHLTRNVRRVMNDRQPGIWRYRHDWMGRSYDYCCLYVPLRHGENDDIRIYSIIVNTDPDRRQLYTGRFESTRKAVKPDQLDKSHRKA